VERTDAIAMAVMRETGVPVHDMRGVAEPAGDGGRVADAVADCVMRQWIVKKYSVASAPRRSGPEAAKGYRQAEAERDAVVPTKYRDAKFGAFAMPPSPEAWKEQRASIYTTVVDSLGDLPPRPSPPRARVVSREIRRGYTLERVAIDNGDDNDISALVLVPEKRQRPAPAILWLHSSTPDKNQLITPNTNGGELPLGEEFVRAGYVVLAPDACLYGERAANGPTGLLESYRRDVADSFIAAQDRLFKWNLWLGRTLWGMFVRDDQIALDYLCSRPEVDRARIGATGMSMGSTRSWWLAAVDDRIAAAVGVACLTRYENLIRHGNLRGHGLYYFSYGILKHFDTEGVLALIAPRPFLALTGDLDYGSPADGIRVLEQKVGRVYAIAGAGDRFKSILYADVGHAYTPEMRQEMLAWFERWLKP
jgi:dienelactone hydrolase